MVHCMVWQMTEVVINGIGSLDLEESGLFGESVYVYRPYLLRSSIVYRGTHLNSSNVGDSFDTTPFKYSILKRVFVFGQLIHQACLCAE